MMLFRLSIKNIKKSFKDYAIYFLTLILGVSIFYVFNAIDSQAAMMNLNKSTKEMIQLMNELLSSVSIFVSLILGFLIIYASRFLIKRRNKEFGIYMILGMGKRKISMILFFETLLIGILSLVVGLLLGVVASQFMSLIVVNMFDADMTKFKFTFSMAACLKSMIYFGIMYVLVMVFNTFSINKCKLIDLLHSSKKTEEVKMKNPVICSIVFAVSCITLGWAYHMVSGSSDVLKYIDRIMIPITLGSVSTFCIFWSLSGLMLKVVMSMKGLYYKNLNSFILRQVSSKINTMILSMTIICLMLFITLGVLTTCISMKDSLNHNLNTMAPVDFQIIKPKQEILNEKDMNIQQVYAKRHIDLDQYTKENYTFYKYIVESVTFKDTLGNGYPQISKKYSSLYYDAYEDIMPVSEYNKVAKLFGTDTFTLKKDEYMIVANMNAMIEIRDQALKIGTNLKVNDRVLKPKYKECKDGNVELASQKFNAGIILVPDDLLKESQKQIEYLMGNYKTDDKKEKQKYEAIVFNDKKRESSDYVISYNTKLDISNASIGLGAIVTFVGLYLGIIFLISSSAILALKELSESSDNRERYAILRKIGVDERILNQALFRQIGIFFLFPLVLAIIHSIFGMKFISIVLMSMGIDLVRTSTVSTYLFLLVIYGIYFILTYLCSKNIIREER